MTRPPINAEDAFTYCRLIVRDEPTEFRLIHPVTGETRHFWGYPENEDQLGMLADYNAEGYGVYAVVNQLNASVEQRCKRRQAARDQDVTAVRAVFIDFDTGTAEENHAKLAASPLTPSLTVCSGLPAKLHAYWVVADLPVEDFRRAQKALAEHFGSDQKIVNEARVMRLPGFENTKPEYAPAAPLARVLTAPGHVHTRAELFAAFNIPSEPPAPPQRAAATVRPPADDRARRYALAALDDEAQAVRNATEGNRNDQLNRSAFNLGQLVGGEALGRAVVEGVLRDAAAAAGLAGPEVEGTLRSGIEAGILEPRGAPERPEREHGRTKRADPLADATQAMNESQGDSSRPEINVTQRLRDITAESLAALDGRELYLRAGVLVRVDDHLAVPLSHASLKGILERAADYVKETTKDGVTITTPARPPGDVPSDILALPPESLPFPNLKAISRTPVLLPGGRMLMRDGFDADSGILVRCNLPGLRNDLPLQTAVQTLRSVFADFPFVDASGLAHTFAMLLQPTVRHVISGSTPLFGVEAPTRGTGKGLLTETTVHITTGAPAPTMSGLNNEELEKRITSLLLEGATHILLDNVLSIKSGVLAAALTAETWRGRRLGMSEMLSLPNHALWIATGNNTEYSDEIARRNMPIRLDAGVERPEERSNFRHPNLKEYVRQNRVQLLSAVLSLVQAWVHEGMPRGSASIGSFESWAAVMGGILDVAGIPGLLGGRENLHAHSDRETEEWGAFLHSWHDTFGQRPVTAGEVFEDILKPHSLLLDIWAGRSAIAAQQRIGHALKSRRDRVFAGLRLSAAGQDGATRNAAYRVTTVETQEGENKHPKHPKHPETPQVSDELAGCFDTPDSQNTRNAGAPQRPTPGVSGVSPGAPRVSSGQAPQNTRPDNVVKTGTNGSPPSVPGVSGVLPPTPHQAEAPHSANGLDRHAANLAERYSKLPIETLRIKYRVAHERATTAPTWWAETAKTEPVAVTIALELLATDQEAGTHHGATSPYLQAARNAVAALKGHAAAPTPRTLPPGAPT